jgi:prepilin-type N-terminal cleavage/methylation domain-containing protein
MMTRSRRDDGFTLIEVLVSIAMISVVTSGLTMFFVQSRASTQMQAQFQQAAQMASAVMERVSLLPGLSLVSGRSATCVTDQWSPGATSPLPKPLPAQVTAYLANMTALPDVSLTQTVTLADCVGSQAGVETLPTTSTNSITVNGRNLNFTQNIYIGTCYLTPNTSNAPTGACTRTGTQATVRIVVAVAWTGKCPSGTCLYLSDSLVPQAVSDVVFNLP